MTAHLWDSAFHGKVHKLIVLERQLRKASSRLEWYSRFGNLETGGGAAVANVPGDRLFGFDLPPGLIL